MSNKQAAIEVIEQLQQHGFQALLAGGCVRDMLLGRPAKDYDVATDAQPADVMRLFRRTLKIGAQFGVVIVLIRNQQVEVATFRSEAGYEDGRHPTEVRFTSAAEDASRRDFTINGMFYDPLNGAGHRLRRGAGRPRRGGSFARSAIRRNASARTTSGCSGPCGSRPGSAFAIEPADVRRHRPQRGEDRLASAASGSPPNWRASWSTRTAPAGRPC